MRSLPLALLLTVALAPVLANAQAVVVDPGQAIGTGPDVTPGYYPTWQSSQPPLHYGARRAAGYYPGTSLPPSDATLQYDPDAEPGTATAMNPYLLQNDAAAPGEPPSYPGHAVDTFLSPFVPQYAMYYSPDLRSSTMIATNPGLFLRRDVEVQYSQIQAGPLFIDFTSIEADALYSDISGPFARSLPPDGFIAAIGLTFNFDIRLSPRTFFEATGTLYYIPTSNRVGFFASGQSTYAHFEHSWEAGRWDVTIFDYIDTISPMNYVLQNLGGSAYDRSGLYTLGFINGGFDRAFDSSLVYFRNTAGIRAATFLGPDLRLALGYEHYDTWAGSDTTHYPNQDHYSAGLFYEPKDSWFMPWLTYDAYFMDNYATSLQQVYAGVTLPYSSTLQGYARVGYAWEEGSGQHGFDTGSLVWDVGANHQISHSWSESLVVGNSYRISPLLQTTSGFYSTYQINFTPADSAFTASAAVTYAQIQPGHEDDWLATLSATYNFDERTSLQGLVMYAPSSWDAGDRTIWLYRAQLVHNLSPTLSLRLIYQYTAYNTTDVNRTYYDNLLWLTITKSL